jgi:hypothetical protein
MPAISTEWRSRVQLRHILAADAATCVATGLALALFAVQLEPLLGLPYALLQYAGIALLPVGGFMAWLALQEDVSKAGVRTVIAGNAAWAAASVAVLFVLSPSPLGYAFVIAQAIAVAALAELEYAGLRRVQAA